MHRDQIRMSSRPKKFPRKCRQSKSQEVCQRRRSSSGKGTASGQQQLIEQQQIRQLVSSCGCVHSLSGGGASNVEEMVRQSSFFSSFFLFTFFVSFSFFCPYFLICLPFLFLFIQSFQCIFDCCKQSLNPL